MISVHHKNIICCLIILYKIIGIAKGTCDNECFAQTNLKIDVLKNDQIELLTNIKDKNYTISTTHKSAFSNARHNLDEIKQFLGKVHVDQSTVKNLNIEIDDLKDIQEDLSAGLIPLYLKINVTEETLSKTKDAFDDLFEEYYKMRDLLNDLKVEEDDLKQESIDGALNSTRESMERLKKAQQTMTESHEMLQDIALACKNLSKITFSYDNTTLETENDQLKTSETILNELLANYTHFNAKMCQVVNVTCQEQNCSDKFCVFKVEKEFKAKIALLENALQEMKSKENELDLFLQKNKELLDELRHAKEKYEDTLLELNAKLANFNTTQHNLNRTMDKLNELSDISSMIDEAKNKTEEVLEVNFLENDDYLKELIAKINDTLKQTTEAQEIIKEATNAGEKTRQLLIKANNSNERANEIEKEVEDVKNILDDTEDLISDLHKKKVEVQKHFNDTKDDINELHDVMPYLQNATNACNSTWNQFDKSRKIVENIFVSTDLAALQSTKDTDATKLVVESVNQGYEKLQNNIFSTNAKIDEHQSIRAGMVGLKERIALFYEKIKDYDEKIHYTVRDTERQIKENDRDLKVYDEQMKSLMDDLEKYSKIIEVRTLFYQECTSNSL